MLRNSSFHHESVNLKRKTSQSRLSSSFSSSKNSLTSYNSLSSSLARKKGYSFGSQSRKSFMQINLTSPAPKYHIQGIVEINLNNKKGPSFGSSREGSVERTPLSYLNSNMNPGPGTYNREILTKSSSSIKIGKRQNEGLKVEFLNEKAINPNPGPGAYHPKLVKLRGGKMTTQSKRFEKHNKENMPGPGTYNNSDWQGVSKCFKSKTISIKL